MVQVFHEADSHLACQEILSFIEVKGHKPDDCKNGTSVSHHRKIIVSVLIKNKRKGLILNITSCVSIW